jgi:hypothetical protein
MKFTPKEIQEYQTIHKEYFGTVITESETREKLSMLVRQVAVIYQPITVRQRNELLSGAKYLKGNVACQIVKEKG